MVFTGLIKRKQRAHWMDALITCLAFGLLAGAIVASALYEFNLLGGTRP